MLQAFIFKLILFIECLALHTIFINSSLLQTVWFITDAMKILMDIIPFCKNQQTYRKRTNYRVTSHLDSYILLTSVLEVPLACLGSS